MIFKQIVHEDLGCASYLIGDEHDGVAAVVDPRFEIEEYRELALYIGARIEHVFETHNHADHVSGHGRLAAATGATIHVHRLAAPEFTHEPFEHGDIWELGGLRVAALHTPGHRPEHTCFVLTDTRRGEDPWAVLTGDSLFVGDVARPDLAVERTGGARAIFHSLHDRLLTLPDCVEVWPGHLGGSMCGGPGMDLKGCSTIGFERAHNPMLQIADELEFIGASVSKLGAQPPNFRAIVQLNRGPLLTDGIELPCLFPAQLRARRSEGATIVDVRSELEIADGHVPGSIAIPLDHGGFGTKLAWVAGSASAIVFVGRDDDQGRLAASLAAAVGLAQPVRLGGLLAGGWRSWVQEDGTQETLRRLPVARIGAELGAADAPQLLDVREPAEFAEGHIPGSISVPWHDIVAIPDGVDPDRATLVVCASGQRAVIAASLLKRLGAASVTHVVGGGVPLWGRLGGQLETGVEPSAAASA